MKRITSVSNDFIKEIKQRHSAKGRKRFADFLIEGPHLLEEAIRAAVQIKFLLFTEDFDAHQFGLDASIELIEVSEQVLKSISTVPNPQGCVAVIDQNQIQKDTTIEKLNRVLVLEGVQDPGNVGTLIRTAEILGWDAIVLDDNCADCFSPKVVRATQGALFHLPMIKENAGAFIDGFKKAGGFVLGTEVRNSVSFESVESKSKICLVLGSEGDGVSETLLQQCDQNVAIPIVGKSESLSVGVAGGILLYHFRPNK